MGIEWDYLIVEMTFLAAIIYGAVFADRWMEKRSERNREMCTLKNIIVFLKGDLKKKLDFIDESLRYKDFKPFFTNMWDAVILGGKQTLFAFEVFENLQHTYSIMKYYNTELKQGPERSEKVLEELLEEVKNSISESLRLLDAQKV